MSQLYHDDHIEDESNVFFQEWKVQVYVTRISVLGGNVVCCESSQSGKSKDETMRPNGTA